MRFPDLCFYGLVSADILFFCIKATIMYLSAKVCWQRMLPTPLLCPGGVDSHCRRRRVSIGSRGSGAVRYKTDGVIHEQERDVSKYWNKTSESRINVRLALLGLENQTAYDRDMPIRVIGYDGASYRAELSQKDRYPVITIVLYFGDKPWGKNRSLFDVFSVPEELAPFVNDYKINVFEIARLPEEAIGYFHSDFKVIVDYFVRKRTEPDYRPKDPEKFRHVDELLKLMSVLTQDSRFEEALEGEGGKPKDMCEVLDRVEARGEARGVEKGIDQTRLENIKNVMEGLKYTAQQAMELLKIPVSDQPKYLAKL